MDLQSYNSCITLSSLISVQHNLILFEKNLHTCIFTYKWKKNSPTQVKKGPNCTLIYNYTLIRELRVGLKLVSSRLRNPFFYQCTIEFVVKPTSKLQYIMVHIVLKWLWMKKKPRKFQFNFPGLLGPCPMLKRLSKKNLSLDLGDTTIYPIWKSHGRA